VRSVLADSKLTDSKLTDSKLTDSKLTTSTDRQSVSFSGVKLSVSLAVGQFTVGQNAPHHFLMLFQRGYANGGAIMSKKVSYHWPRVVQCYKTFRGLIYTPA
jgi:hypothetical protein